MEDAIIYYAYGKIVNLEYTRGSDNAIITIRKTPSKRESIFNHKCKSDDHFEMLKNCLKSRQSMKFTCMSNGKGIPDILFMDYDFECVIL